MDESDVTPVRVGRHVTIRPVHAGDYSVLYEIAMFSDAGSRWRLQASTPSQDEFLRLIFENSRATFAIEKNDDHRVIGMVQLWMYDGLSRNGHITTFLVPWARGRGWPLESIILFVDYVFKGFNLHKLYFESLSPEFEQYGSIVGRILRPEGCLKDHKWVFGPLVDYHILALYAEDVPKLTRLLRSRPIERSDHHEATRHINPVVLHIADS